MEQKNTLKRSVISGAACAVAVGASATGELQASIVVYNTPFTVKEEGETWYLEGVGGSTPLALQFTASTSFGIFPGIPVNNFRFADSPPETPRNLAFGETVDSAVFSSAGDGGSLLWDFGNDGDNAGFQWAEFTIGQADYAGFRFDSGDGVKYGWVNLTILSGNDGFRMNQWAYETDGSPITVGAVPEPSAAALAGLGALAAGIAGMRQYKRRREAE